MTNIFTDELLDLLKDESQTAQEEHGIRELEKSLDRKYKGVEFLDEAVNKAVDTAGAKDELEIMIEKKYKDQKWL